MWNGKPRNYTFFDGYRFLYDKMQKRDRVHEGVGSLMFFFSSDSRASKDANLQFSQHLKHADSAFFFVCSTLSFVRVFFAFRPNAPLFFLVC